MLEKIRKGKQKKPRKVVVYGLAGIGKSTFATSAPGAIVTPMEKGGLDDIDCHSFPTPDAMKHLGEQLEFLLNEKHEYKTYVLDGLDSLEAVMVQHILGRDDLENMRQKAMGESWTDLLDEWKKFLSKCDQLRDEKGMGIILTCHHRIKTYTAPDTDPYDRYMPNLTPKISTYTQGWAQELLFMTYKAPTVVTTDKGFGAKQKQAIGDGERVMYTCEKPQYIAKRRLDLPDEMPLSWEEYYKVATGK